MKAFLFGFATLLAVLGCVGSGEKLAGTVDDTHTGQGMIFNPDGHPDHRGAWPADAYYGDPDGEWPDTLVDSSKASRAENKNVPGDGKFDPTFLPSDVKLEVGRVDLSQMPAFGKTETELLRRYLDKDHAFRHRTMEVEKRLGVEALESREERVEGAHSTKVTLLIS